MHDRSIKLRYGRNLVTKPSTFSYPSCDYIIDNFGNVENVNMKPKDCYVGSGQVRFGQVRIGVFRLSLVTSGQVWLCFVR